MSEFNILRDKFKSFDALSFLDNSKIVEEEIEIACVTFLKSLGYKVVKKPVFAVVTKLDDLITLFYTLDNYYHHSVCDTVSNKQKDRKIFSTFISQRQEELKCSFKEGLQDCANIIKALFIFESSLDLTVPLGTWVFSSNKYKWLIDKVISMLDDNTELLNDKLVERKAEEDELRSNEYTGFDFEKLRRLYGE